MLVGGESGSTGGLFPSASLPFCPENTFFVRKVENASFAIHPVDFIAACTSCTRMPATNRNHFHSTSPCCLVQTITKKFLATR